jgi:transcriptional regulator with XRE-family HTH domain
MTLTVVPESWRYDLLRACERAAGSASYGAGLRRAREAVGITQSTLASMARLNQPAIAHAESGARHLSDPDDAAVRAALELVLEGQLRAAAIPPDLHLFVDAYVPQVLIAALISGGRARAEAFAWSWGLRLNNRHQVFGPKFSRRLVPGVEVGAALEARIRGMTVEQMMHGAARAAETWADATDNLAATGERRLLTEVGHALAGLGMGEKSPTSPAPAVRVM